MPEVQVRFSVDAYLRDCRYEPGNEALDFQDNAWFRDDFTDWLVAVPTSRGEVQIFRPWRA